MRFMIRFSIPNDAGNAALKDPEFGPKLGKLLEELGTEAAYFTTPDAQRGGYLVVNMNDASEIPLKAEALFLWLKADVEIFPVMTIQDLAKAGPGIQKIVQKYA